MSDSATPSTVKRDSLLELPASAWGSAIEDSDAAYRGDQLANWVFQQGVFEFGAMSNLPAALRRRLAERYSVAPPGVARVFESVDGTRRFLLQLSDGARGEWVYMPYPDRVTLCISSQVGCRFDCGFCQTGQMGLQRSVSATRSCSRRDCHSSVWA